jgi:diguanylate cyclase (GGDEF)-like protein
VAAVGSIHAPRWGRSLHRPATPARRVMLFASLLAVSAIVVVSRELGWHQPGSHLGLSWPILVAGFGVSEILCVHLEFRRDAFTLTFSDIPMIIGLIAFPPAYVVVARFLGAGLALVFHRRQTGVKLAVNLASFSFEVAVAGAVYHAVLGHAAVFGPAGWLAAGAAAVTFNASGAVTVPIAVALYRGASTSMGWRSVAVACGVFALTNTSLALIVAIVLAEGRLAGAILAPAAAVLYLFTRAHASLRQRYANLQILYDFTRKVSASGTGEAMVVAMLEETRSLLRAEMAELFLVGENEPRPLRTVLTEGGIRTSYVEAGDERFALEARVMTSAAALVVGRSTVSREERRCLDQRGLRDVVVAPLRLDDDVMGSLVVGNRLGDVSTFDEEDCRLFQALADLAAVALEKGRLIDQLRQEAVEKEYQALHDSLTGLPNRTLFHQTIDAALAVRTDDDEPVAVMLMDLDRFKDVNDTLGHHSGDALLKEIGARLTATLGMRGMVSRLGGDEFGILLPAAGAEVAQAVADGLRVALEQPLSLGDLSLEIGTSVGIALSPDHGAVSSILLQRADVAMYAAKAQNAGIAFYAADTDRNSARRLTLLSELRRAIDGDELVVYYQPKASLRTGRVVGVEALVRWNHPDHGILPPGEFIPAAEHSGLMTPLTRRVLEASLAQCRQWHADGKPLGLAVNLPVRSLMESNLPADINHILDQSGVAAEHLTLEITESTLMIDPPRAIAVLRRLADLGLKLAIDDFGTGYSSLSYLKSLPVTELKIDRSFVSCMTSDPKDAAIVRSTTELGHNLGLNVVAEGVEDWDTWQRLLMDNVDIAQGYLLSKPVPARELEAWLVGWHPYGAEPRADRKRLFALK